MDAKESRRGAPAVAGAGRVSAGMAMDTAQTRHGCPSLTADSDRDSF